LKYHTWSPSPKSGVDILMIYVVPRMDKNTTLSIK